MLQGLTWGQFGLFIGGALMLYYLWLVGTGKMGARTTGKQPPGQPPPPPPEGSKKRIWKVEESTADDEEERLSNEQDEINRQQESDDREFEALESLANDVHQAIVDAEPSISKEDLLLKVRQEIARYPTLNKPAFKAAIKNVIIRSAQNECNITVAEREADELWN